VKEGLGPDEKIATIGVQAPRYKVRRATHEDVPEVIQGVIELLIEIGGNPAPAEHLERAARDLIDHPAGGAIVVAECERRVVGLLGASWQSAIRVPGRYGLIQELWVAPAYRHLEIGKALVDELARIASEQGVERLEVGLPGERYADVAATESFYERNQFKAIGLRMRRLL
jgi:ribosomal protein S18 acetylase RimI-like enzyme